MAAFSYSCQKVSWFHKYKLVFFFLDIFMDTSVFLLPIIFSAVDFFVFVFLKKRKRNGETLTCLYPQIKLNWIGNKWPLKHCFHLLVLPLMTDNFLIFILKQAQWHQCSSHCMKERQSQEFVFIWLSNWFFKIGNLYSYLYIL